MFNKPIFLQILLKSIDAFAQQLKEFNRLGGHLMQVRHTLSTTTLVFTSFSTT